MNYSVDKLASVAECDAVLALLSEQKTALAYKKNLLVHRQDLVGKSAVEIASEMVGLDQRIAVFEPLALSLPEGDAKIKNGIDLENARHRKFQLNTKLLEQGSVALLGIEIDLGQIGVQETELAAAEAAVIARKATL